MIQTVKCSGVIAYATTQIELAYFLIAMAKAPIWKKL